MGKDKLKKKSKKKQKHITFEDEKIEKEQEGQKEETKNPKGGKIDNLKLSLLNAPIKQKMIVIGAVVLLCVGLYYWYKRRESKEKKTIDGGPEDIDKHVTWADEEGRQLLEYQDAEFEEQDRRMQQMEYAEEIENVLVEIDRTSAIIQKNENEMKKTNRNMDNIFGDNSASYETSLEQDHSIDTEFEASFMMKTDIDKKRQGMVNLNQELGKTQKQLLDRTNQLKGHYDHKQRAYYERYGQAYIPRRVVAARNRPRPPQPPKTPPQPPPQGEQQFMQMQQQPMAQIPRTPMATGSGPGDAGRGGMNFAPIPQQA